MIWAFWIDSVPITRAVLDGTTSLGGSESACLGLMRALAARGHLVHAFTPKLAEDAVGPDGTGLAWHKGDEFHGNEVWLHTEWDVYVSLRMPYAIGGTMIPARWRILWNQDLLNPSQADQTMGSLWQTDTIAYVSAFHRHQWEGLIPGAAPLGWVTRNGYDPAMVPGEVTKAPSRIIHISRPERSIVRLVRDGMRHGVQLGPLLQMWPQVRAQRPDAELHLCRYSSMYDAGHWGKVCEAADDMVAEVQRQVGGIVYLGELGKPDLYRAIAESAVMWYPGVVDFAETGCIAAVEAQACGTPFIGSYKGALPETAPHSVLVKGDATSPEYQVESVAAVLDALNGCRHQTRAYRERIEAGRRHVTPAYTYDAIAAEWEAYVLACMDARSANRQAILATQLMTDDHMAARIVATELGDADALAYCNRVINGEDQTVEDYADRAVENPLVEMTLDQRFDYILEWYGASQRLLDVACGNGTAAIKLALSHPHLRIVGVDYSERNLERARVGAAKVGVSDRVSFVCLPVYDYQTHDLAWPFVEWLRTQEPFDALFCGEFLEHCANAEGLIDGLEQACAPGAVIGYTMPHGPFTTLLPRSVEIKRGHVHALELDDVGRLFGAKEGLILRTLNAGINKRTYPIGHWLVKYQKADEPRPAQPRDYAYRIRSLRPQPRLSALIIAHNEAHNLASCLESIWGVVDEIVIGDCGSTDETCEVAGRYGAKMVTLPRISAVQEIIEPDGRVIVGFDFSDARNNVLRHCTGDWVLWIDADETLEGAIELGKYLTAGPFLGYAIRQVHLAVDIPKHHDLPVRCFRRRPDIRWYGSIHEQPQLRDCNTDITPALELPDVQIAHRGYRTEGMRQQKRKRNLPLLELDRKRYPDRRLGLVLWLRDLVLEAEEDRALHGGRLTPKAANYLTEAIDTFEEHLNDPTDKLYQFSRPWYESAVKLTKEPWEFVYTLVGQQGGLNGTRPQLRRVWVRQPTDIEGVIASDLAKIKASLEPKPLVVDPPDKEAPGELAPQ